MTAIPMASPTFPMGLSLIIGALMFSAASASASPSATKSHANASARANAGGTRLTPMSEERTAPFEEPLQIALAPPGDARWKPLRFRSIERPTLYEVRSDSEGRPAFRATSDCGASALLLQLPPDFDLTRTPRLAWRWRIEQGIGAKAADEKSEAGDDFAARVYVLHGFDADRATAWQRMEHKMGSALFDAETPGETINYVWASQVARGESWTSPSRSEARLLALESGWATQESESWREAVVDLPRDAQRLFSLPPRKPPYAIGLMSDADGVCRKAVAWFSDFRLLGPEIQPPRPAKNGSIAPPAKRGYSPRSAP